MMRDATVVTGPVGFDALFPGSGGALYGRAGHGAGSTHTSCACITDSPVTGWAEAE